MKKVFLISFVLIFVFSLFAFKTKLINASYSSYLPVGKALGGVIFSTKATEIKQAEIDGYTCTVPGKTITIKPYNMAPKSYFIPYSVPSKTRIPLSVGAFILGEYKTMKKNIICESDSLTGGTITIPLPIMTLYGNSF